jgi:membrane-bound ClpP family serine protease
MNYTPFILLLAGLILMFLEFFLPGGVLGIAAGIVIFASIIFFALQFSFGWTVLYIVGIILLVVLMARMALKRLKMGKLKGIYLSSAQEGYQASEYEKNLIGKKGIALSDLKPSGHILVEGKRYQAVSKLGYIDKGAEIDIVGGEGAHLIVKLAKENDT